MAQADFSRIATNIGALNALQSLNNINGKLGIHQQRLATGKRINSAADDPAGLTIATKLNARSEGLKVALDNIGDAKNLLAVAESGMGRISDIMVQMRNKAEAAASDTLGQDERKAIVTQMQAYAEQIDDIVSQTKWNGTALINGDFESTALTFQTGADQGDTTSLKGLKNLKASGAELDLASKASTSTVSVKSDTAFDIINTTVPTAAHPLNANLSELASGTYTIEVTYGGTAGSASFVRLKDANGNYLSVDADGTRQASGADPVDTRVDGLDLDDTAKLVDFGNGLQVTINDLATATPNANGTYEATLTYTAAGIYTLNKVGSGDLTETSTASEFAAYMNKINDKLNTVSNQLSMVGALAGRLTFKEDQVSVAQLNVEASYNRIMNADMAYEQLEATKYSILQQTSTTMLAQANTAPQGILSLFR